MENQKTVSEIRKALYSPNYLIENKKFMVNEYKIALSLYNSLGERNVKLSAELDYMYIQRLISVYDLDPTVHDLHNYKLSMKEYRKYYYKHQVTISAFIQEIQQNRSTRNSILGVIKANKKRIKLANDYLSMRINKIMH